MTGGTGHQDRGTRPLSPCMVEMAGRDPFTDTPFASQDPLCLSPEDDLRPPASKTLSVSPQRMTCGPLRARPSLSLPARERTWFQRFGETRAPASLPRKRSGETKRGLPLHRREPGSGGWAKHWPLRLSPHRGDQEGSSDAGILRVPHRVTDPRFAAEHRAPAGLPHNPSGKQEQRKAKTDADRGSAATPEASARWRGVFRSLVGRSKRGRPQPEPESRLYGMNLRSSWGRPWLNVSVPW